jgi:glutathione synthase/RimK-type ligase-like ATP-grasp enzyme
MKNVMQGSASLLRRQTFTHRPIYAPVFIAKHATRLGRLAALHPVHDANTIKNCRDKGRFAQFTAEHAILTPQTLLFSGKARDDLGVFDRGSAVL